MGGGASRQIQVPTAATAGYTPISAEQAKEEGQRFFDQFTAVRSGTAQGADDGVSVADGASSALDTASALNDMLNTTVNGAVAITQIAQVSSATVEGLLSLGTQLPMFGAVAGVFLMFYGKCKAMMANNEALQSLIKANAEAGR
jgi:hypothetical protein